MKDLPLSDLVNLQEYVRFTVKLSSGPRPKLLLGWWKLGEKPCAASAKSSRRELELRQILLPLSQNSFQKYNGVSIILLIVWGQR